MFEFFRTFVLILLPTLVYILGDYLSVYLPMYFKTLDRKPFNCRPCLTFHLSWISLTVVAIIFKSTEIIPIGITYAFLIFFITYRIDKNKITE